MSATDVIAIAVSPVIYTAVSAGKRKARYAADGSPWPPANGEHITVGNVQGWHAQEAGGTPSQDLYIAHKVIRLRLVRLGYMPNTTQAIQLGADAGTLSNFAADNGLNIDVSSVEVSPETLVALYNAISDAYAARFGNAG